MSRRKGNCYVASEALYHLIGGKKSGWKPMFVKHEGTTHWFLKHYTGHILDLTSGQFKKWPPYHKAIGCGFLTKQPSKRAAELIDKIQWQ